MQSNSAIKSLTILLLGLSIFSAALVYGQQKSTKKDPPLTEEQLYKLHVEAKVKPPSGAAFYIAPITETPGRFSMAFTDNEGRFISDMYVRRQLDILEALLIEAKEFAQSGEAVGVKRPIITRLKDRSEPAFFVDVSKMGNHSQFFITINSLEKFITMEAGTIKRGDPKSKALLYDILTRVQEAKNAPQVSQ
jgi:hypothetical protein